MVDVTLVSRPADASCVVPGLHVKTCLTVIH